MLYSDGDECSMQVAVSSSFQPSNHELLNYSCDTLELQDWTQFERCLTERATHFLDDPKLQYVAVRNVSTSDLEEIDHLRGRCDLPQMRILYDEDEEVMIIKLMPGPHHEMASIMFLEFFQEQAPRSTSDIDCLLSRRFGEANRKHKEPDLCFLQRSTRSPTPDWPSLVVEVGVFESLPQLQEDARYWLTSSRGRVMTVVLISINKTIGSLKWERWQHEPIGGQTTQSQQRINPTLVQCVDLPRGGPVIGAPFRIPSDKIWDVVPANVGAEIQFSAQQLTTFFQNVNDYD